MKIAKNQTNFSHFLYQVCVGSMGKKYKNMTNIERLAEMAMSDFLWPATGKTLEFYLGYYKCMCKSQREFGWLREAWAEFEKENS